MSSITTQQIKLDLELVPKEKRLKIGKCNRRLNPGKIQREPTFQVVLDTLSLTLCYSAFLITADVPEVYMHQLWDSVYKHDTFYRFKMDKRKRFKLNLEIFRDIFKICPRIQNLGHTGEINSLNDVVVDQMHQPLRTFVALINRSLSGKTTGLDKLCLSKAQILWDKTLSWRNKIGMHTSRDDYLINTLRFVSAKEETQIYGAILPKSLTSPEMKETKAYKTYLVFATRATPPKKVRKFKKPASPKLTTVPVSPEEPMVKSKRVKRPTKKSTKAPARGVVIRETPEMPLSKKKEKVDVTRGKGIELLSDVALTEEAQYEEVRRKRTGVKPRVPNVIEEESSESEAESWGNDEDDNNNEQDSSEENEEDEDDEEEVNDEFVKTPSNDSDDEDETKITDKAEGDEDEEMDYTTSQLYDDVNIRLNEPVDIDKGFV
ncbi:hypothetical protein Tco_0012516 [Tanacetum coccineum]